MQTSTKLKITFNVLVLLAILLVPAWSYMVGPGYEYRNAVHSHMENAYQSNDPVLMKQEVQAAIAGMRSLGLTPEMCGSLWPWERLPDNCMKYQYEHLDGIVLRIEEVIQWRQNQGEAVGAQVTDVYEQKMDNLRAFLKEGTWSDWIAEDSWLAEVNPGLWLWYGVFEWVVVLLAAGVWVPNIIRNW